MNVIKRYHVTSLFTSIFLFQTIGVTQFFSKNAIPYLLLVTLITIWTFFIELRLNKAGYENTEKAMKMIKTIIPLNFLIVITAIIFVF